MLDADQRLIVQDDRQYKGYKQNGEQEKRIGYKFEFGCTEDPEEPCSEEQRDKMADGVAKRTTIEIE